MPVTFSPVNRLADSRSSPALTPLQCLAAVTYKTYAYPKVKEIIQSSLSTKDESNPTVVPRGNGFVQTLSDAYNNHHALIIRPDDVWTSILTQFSFFVGGRAEALRSAFVDHEGKKTLTIVIPSANRYTFDLPAIAQTFTQLIHENIKDESLREWMIPNFSTTTPNDQAIASMVMMATMKPFFQYKLFGGCGLPRVTMEGDKGDWELLLSKVEKLKEYGIEAIAWYHLLVPVLTRFVRAFDAPESKENSDFWQTVSHHQPGGSGIPDYWTGWIAAFCVFESKKGRWIGPPLRKPSAKELQRATTMTSQEFWSTFRLPFEDPEHTMDERPIMDKLSLDDTTYQHVHTIPSGFVEVPVTVDDHGYQFEAGFIAGQIGLRVISSHDKTLSESGQADTLAPVSGWWFFEHK